MKRAESQALRTIAQLHRELAEACERLATAGAEPERSPASSPPSTIAVSEECLNATRRALRKKGIAA
jgi:hypothetical protein